MNHELVKGFGKKLDSLTVSDYHGLSGPGLTCYLNSVLQVLFMTDDFRAAVKKSCSEDPATIDSLLGKLFADLEKHRARTHNITKKLGIANVYEQRDAAEYFEKILCRTSPEAASIFRGELNHKTTCLRCHERRNSTSVFWLLPLVVEESSHRTCSVERGLESYFRRERVGEDNKMYCARCDNKEDVHFGCEISRAPEVLTLLLKRFDFDHRRGCYVKLQCKVDVPQTLHLQDCKYDLYALVSHSGNLTGGHYTAQIKSCETNLWYDFDDNNVTAIRQPLFGSGNARLRSRAAYLLMYRKVRRRPENTAKSDLEVHCTNPDVEDERHDEAEGGPDEDLSLHHQLKDNNFKGGELVKVLNGDVLQEMWRRPTNLPRQLDKHLQSQIPEEEVAGGGRGAGHYKAKSVPVPSSSSLPHYTGTLNENTGGKYSHNFSRSNVSKGDREKIQHMVPKMPWK